MLRRSRRAAIGATGAAIALVLSGCASGAQPPPSPSATPRLSTPTATGSPTGTAVTTPVRLRKGTATFRVGGSLKRKLTLSLGSSGAYQPAPGQFSFSFIDRSGDALIVNGATPSGTTRTSTALTLTIVLQTSHPLPFPSSHGECAITVTGSGPTRLTARFSCRNLLHGPKTIRATGTFDAKR